MTLKDKLTQLQTTLTSLNTKIKSKLNSLEQQITQANNAVNQKTNQLNEVNRKLELSMKEQSENERVLSQLLQEFKELEQSL